ncbi:putative transposase [Duganella sp. CF517]|uniref:REP-associated tyrosine transposase n=1 Tax=Duganella sp. CF517 TaxID=1881038 RepID=UPI0008B3ADEA|nr:transposase [Duganella sp. CF517]SEN78903.1 putative transposase [Duganella sp. CF517]
MSDLKPLFADGDTYFLTMVTAHRAPIFSAPEARMILRTAIQKVRRRHPFEIVGMVVLPDHLHALWRLPHDDYDFSLRWRLIKTHMTRYAGHGKRVWQQRHREHTVRDERDLSHHLDYLHWNPVKHGLVERVQDWPWSSFHRYVAAGVYPVDWCGSSELTSVVHYPPAMIRSPKSHEGDE